MMLFAGDRVGGPGGRRVCPELDSLSLAELETRFRVSLPENPPTKVPSGPAHRVTLMHQNVTSRPSRPRSVDVDHRKVTAAVQ